MKSDMVIKACKSHHDIDKKQGRKTLPTKDMADIYNELYIKQKGRCNVSDIKFALETSFENDDSDKYKIWQSMKASLDRNGEDVLLLREVGTTLRGRNIDKRLHNSGWSSSSSKRVPF